MLCVVWLLCAHVDWRPEVSGNGEASERKSSLEGFRENKLFVLFVQIFCMFSLSQNLKEREEKKSEVTGYQVCVRPGPPVSSGSSWGTALSVCLQQPTANHFLGLSVQGQRPQAGCSRTERQL